MFEFLIAAFILPEYVTFLCSERINGFFKTLRTRGPPYFYEHYYKAVINFPLHSSYTYTQIKLC